MTTSEIDVASLAGWFAIGGVAVTTLGNILGSGLQRLWGRKDNAEEREHALKSRIHGERIVTYAEYISATTVLHDENTMTRQKNWGIVRSPNEQFDSIRAHLDAYMSSYQQVSAKAELLAGDEVFAALTELDEFMSHDCETAIAGQGNLRKEEYDPLRIALRDAMNKELHAE